jgi:hypothetical protein
MQTHTILRKGHRIKKKGLYRLKVESLANVKICNIEHSYNVKMVLLWHRKLGHINFQTFHEMSKGLGLGLPKLPYIDHICDICQIGKQSNKFNFLRTQCSQ